MPGVSVVGYNVYRSGTSARNAGEHTRKVAQSFLPVELTIAWALLAWTAGTWPRNMRARLREGRSQ